MSKDDHGQPSTYTNHGCRCEKCRKAWAEYHREYMHRTGRIGAGANNRSGIIGADIGGPGSAVTLPALAGTPGGPDMPETTCAMVAASTAEPI